MRKLEQNKALEELARVNLVSVQALLGQDDQPNQNLALFEELNSIARKSNFQLQKKK